MIEKHRGEERGREKERERERERKTIEDRKKCRGK